MILLAFKDRLYMFLLIDRRLFLHAVQNVPVRFQLHLDTFVFFDSERYSHSFLNRDCICQQFLECISVNQSHSHFTACLSFSEGQRVQIL